MSPTAPDGEDRAEDGGGGLADDATPADAPAPDDLSEPAPGDASPEGPDGAPDDAGADGASADAAPEPEDTGPARLCEPGATAPCYEGSNQTRRRGTCRDGVRTCSADGLAWGPCEGQVLPAVEGCAFSCDEDCDGRLVICPAGTRCNVTTNACEATTDTSVVIAAPFSENYRVFDLGSPPGVPGPLGGTVVRAGDPDTLLIAGDSESSNGAIYSIGVTRNACGHMTGFSGRAVQVAATPNVDANLVYASDTLLLYTMYRSNRIGQVLFGPGGAVTVGPELPLSPFGVASSVGGLGLVPAGLGSATGRPRTLSWSSGQWNHVDLATDAADGRWVSVTGATAMAGSALPNGPGGFAYVPAGSPGFAAQSLIVSEWSASTVGVYEVDAQGDPMATTRRDFFSAIPRPWGAYFEPGTGDFLFLDWRSGSTRVYLVQGFAPPTRTELVKP